MGFAPTRRSPAIPDLAHSPPRAATLDQARGLLAETWGYADFRDGQAEVVGAILAGEDVLAVMPTGSGKSLCFQLPALLLPNVTLVVSPLLALMRDQVAALERLGVAAACLNSEQDPGERRRVEAELESGRLKLLYLSPERLSQPATQERLARQGVALLAIDEAHCVSQWGHDFRPEYRLLGEIAARLEPRSRAAFTATADPATQGDIAVQLFVGQPRLVVRGFDRPNLRLAMAPKAGKKRQLLEFLEPRKAWSGIVYCATRRKTEETALLLAGEGFKAEAYHAGMEPDRRRAVETRFQREDGRVVVATVAFGMGIDKPDIRFVCHADLPGSIESYYQEIGRAGRDGLPAETLTLWGLDDVKLRRRQIDESEAPEAVKRMERHRLAALVALCEAPRCRRQTLLAYFGEKSGPCGNCDLCAGGVELVEATELAQKALSVILRTEQRFGLEHLVTVLRGEKSEQVLRFGHDRIKTFGVGADVPAGVWRGLFRQLYAAGLAEMDIQRYGAWQVTEEGWRVLRGELPFQMRREALEAGGGGRRARVKRAAPIAAELEGDAQERFERLRALRREIAEAEKVPAYVVFHDRTLLEMARANPADALALSVIPGVGAAKLKRYGERFLAALQASPS